MNAPFTKDGHARRILALWFPHLPTERILRRRLGRSWRSGARPDGSAPDGPPLVVSRRDNNAQRVAALDERAEALNLRPGMGIADARAMHPAIEIVEADPQADRQLLEGLADWCDRYTPLVAIEGTDGLFLDISGCAHLFGGEKAMLDAILRRLFDQGFDVRAGLASTPGAAWAAARYLSPSLLMPGAEAEALAPLPLAALRLEPAVRAGLESVGLRTAGAIMAAPRAPLARRFGGTLLLRLDQALGRLEEAISPRLPVAPLSVERHLAEPIVMVEDVEHLVAMLATTLKADLERRGEGARVLALALFRVDGDVHRLCVGTSLPVREPAVIRRLFHEKLAAAGEAFEAGCGFELVRLSVLKASLFEMEQGDFASTQAGDEASLALFADRVGARLGQQSLTWQVPAASHVPERAAITRAFATEPPPPARSNVQPVAAAAPERPIRLLAWPEPVEAMAEVPEGPPRHFRWRRALHRVSRAEGPERISGEWWLDPEPPLQRDYFRVEDSEGARYWLYREGLYGDGVTPRWFMHGIFA